jgi:hypothetical protein
MTEARKARLEGWNVSLKQRGVLLSDPSERQFLALVSPLAPSSASEYELSRETNALSAIEVARNADNLNLGIGTSLTDVETGYIHRIAIVEDNPANVAIKLTCVTFNAS